MNIRKSTLNVCITGIGIALFVTLSMCLRVPVFENYYLCLGYIVTTLWLYSVGIFSGSIVCIFGTILYCFLINGLRGLPGWTFGNIFIVVFVGLSIMYSKNLKHTFSKYLAIISGIISGCFLGIFIAKSIVEHLLYSQPVVIRMANNIYAMIADIVVLLFSIPICFYIDKIITKHNLLLKGTK